MENNNDAFDFNSWANSVLNQGENKSNNFSVDSLLNDATKLPVSYYGAYNTSDYKKYLGSSAVEEVGINPGWSNRDFEVKFDEAQPYSEAVANTLSKFVDITKDATVNYFKSYYTGADDLIAYNQKKAQEDSDKGFSDPTFTSSTKSGLGSVFSTDFYENLFPSLGYVVGTMGSAVLENVAIDLLTGGAGAGAEFLNSGKKVKNTINYLLNVDKIKGALKAEEALTGIQKFKAGAQMYNMINGVRSEAAMEGGNNAFETLEKQKKEFKDTYGYEPFGEDLERMENYAKSAGKADYYLNLPILMASNLVQFSDLLIPEVVKASTALEDTWKGYNLVNKGTALAPQLELEQKTFSSLWESAKGLDKVKAVAQYTSEIPAFKYLTSAGSEGMEESLQKMASTLSQDYYLNKSKGTESVWDSTKYGLGEMFTDEGVQEFLGGFMIGSLSHARHGAIDIANKTKDLFTKKEDRPVRLSEKDIEFNKMKEKVSYLNDTSLDKVLKSDGIKDAFVNGQLSREMKAFSKNGDIFNLKNSQDHALLNYLWAGYKTGKLDYRLAELEKIANLDYSKDEMASMLGVSVNELNDKRGSQAVRNIIDKVKANKVNFQAVEDHFEKNSNVGELREQYNNDSNDLSTLMAMYANKYKAKSFDQVIDKLNERETRDLFNRQLRLEESKANLIAYNEGVKVAAFSYASLQNDKVRQAGIFNTLANNSKLDYTAARELMNVSVAQERKKQLQEAIKTGKAINDPQVKNYEKQLELVNNIIEQHDKGQYMSPNKMAKLLQDFAHESLPETERIKIRKDAILMNDLNPLTDAVKLEKKNRRNVELYDYLMDIKNFSNYNKKISEDILKFRSKTLDWFAQMNEPEVKPETVATEEKPAATEKKDAKFKKGDKVTYNNETYTVDNLYENLSIDGVPAEITYSLIDTEGELLVDENGGKKHVKESELKLLVSPAPVATPSPAPVKLTAIEEKKKAAIAEFIKNNPLYKEGEVEFTTEKTADGKTINKVISKNPTNRGEDLSTKKEFADIINQLNATQQEREKEKEQKEELKDKVSNFYKEKKALVEGIQGMRLRDKQAFVRSVRDFIVENNLAALPEFKEQVDMLKELYEDVIQNIPQIDDEVTETEGSDLEDNDFVDWENLPNSVDTYDMSFRPDSPLKTITQEERVKITYSKDGTIVKREGLGDYADSHLPVNENGEQTYGNFVQQSLVSSVLKSNLFSSDPDAPAPLKLVLMMDSAKLDYERSESFKEAQRAGKDLPFGAVLVIVDENNNPVKFNNDYSINTTGGGRTLVYQFTDTAFDIETAVSILMRYGLSEDDARLSIITKLDALRHIRKYLRNNPDQVVPVTYKRVSNGVIGGSSTNITNAKDFLKDLDFELEVVKSEDGSKETKFVPFRNGTAMNGSLVAITEDADGEETVLTMFPKRLSNDLVNEINAILAHTFVTADNKLDPNVRKVKTYLDSLIYTRKGARQFVIQNNRIVYKDGENTYDKIPGGEIAPYLNIYSKNLNNDNTTKPSFKVENGVVSLQQGTNGEVKFKKWDYNNFVVENTIIKGIRLEGRPIIKFNRYLEFNIPMSSLEQVRFVARPSKNKTPNQAAPVTASPKATTTSKINNASPPPSDVTLNVKNSVLFQANGKSYAKIGNDLYEFSTAVKAFQFAQGEENYPTKEQKENFAKSVEGGKVSPVQAPAQTSNVKKETFAKKNIFTVTPQPGVSDEKAKAKASIATQLIAFGEGIVGKDGKKSTTFLYGEEVKQKNPAIVNSGNYSANDVVFVSIPGKRGDAAIAKREQDKVMIEARNAIEAGATIITDNKEYTEKSTYNTGEKRMLKNFEAKGYVYSETVVDGQTLGVWRKGTTTKEKVQDTEAVKKVKSALKALDEKTIVLNTEDADNTFYYNENNPEETFKRVSELKGERGKIKGDSADRGTIIDSLLRDFVAGDINTLSELIAAYNNHDKKDKVRKFTPKFLENLFGIFTQLDKEIKSKNIQLISDIPTLWGTLNGENFAGTIDLLGIADNGSVYIIDLKTSSRNRRDSSDEYYSKYKKGDTIQQSAYAELLRQRTGITVSSVSILPIQVTFDDATYNKAFANLHTSGKMTMPVEIDRTIFPENPMTDLGTVAPNEPGGNITKQEVIEPNDEIDPIIPENASETKIAAINARNNLFNRFNRKNSEDKDALERRKEVINELAEHLMDENEWGYLRKIVGKDNITNLFDVANSNAWATWTTAGVTLWSNPKKGTGYHESWHHFSQLYLTTKQKVALYNEVRRTNPKLKDATDLEVEEYLADDFMNFMLSGGKTSELFNETPVKKNIFQKIWNLLKALFGTSNVNIQKLYNDLRVGDLNKYTPSVNNALWGKLDRAIYNQNTGAEILPVNKVDKYVRYTDFIISQVLTEKRAEFKNMSLLDMNSLQEFFSDLENMKDLYAIVKEYFEGEAEANPNLSKSIISDYKKITSPEVWGQFIAQHQLLNKIGISTDVDAEDIVGVGLEMEKDKNFTDKFDRSSNAEDLFATADQAIKNLFRLIATAKYDKKLKKGVIVYDKNGLAVLADQKKLWDRVAVELEGITDFDKMVEKLKDPSVQMRLPEATQLLDLLPMNPGKDRAKLSLRQSFLQSFTNPYIPSYTGYINKKGDFQLIENTRTGEASIRKVFVDNFNSISKNNKYFRDGMIAETKDGIRYITKEVANLIADQELKTYFNTPSNVMRLLSLIGVEFDNDIIFDEFAFKEFKSKVNNDDLIRLYKNIKDRANSEDPDATTNPIDTLAKKTPISVGSATVTFASNYSVINKIVAFATKYNKSDPSLSFIGANGERIYGIQKHNGFSQRLSVINNVKSAKELFATSGFESYNPELNPHSRNSVWLNLLFDMSKPEGPRRIDKKTGKPVTIDIINYNGLDIEPKEKGDRKVQKSTADLSGREKFLLDLLSFVNNGKIDIIRTESAQSFYSIAPSTYHPKSEAFNPLMISFTDVSLSDNIFGQPEFQDVVKGYLNAEMYKIQNGEEIYGKYLTKNKDEEKSEFHKVVNFTLFADILSDDLKKKLKEELKTKTIEQVLEDNNNIIEEQISNYFRVASQEYMNMFAEYNITESDIPQTMKSSYISDLVKEKNKELAQEINKVKTEQERQVVFKKIQDKYAKLTSEKIDELKQKLADTFIANHFIQAVEFTKFFEADMGYYKDYFKRSKGMNSTGSPALTDRALNEYLASTPSMASALGVKYNVDDFNVAKTAAFKDDERASTLNDPDNKTEKIGNRVVTKMVHDKLVSLHALALIKNPKAPFSFKEAEIEAVEKELEAYSKTNGADGQGHCTLDFYRFVKNKFGNWSAEEEALYRAEVIKFNLHKKIYKSDAEIAKANKQLREYIKKAKGVTFPVIKVNYRGPAKNKAFTPVMDKFSLAPLLIDSIKGTTLEDINEKMLKGKIAYTKFQSGSKLWLPKLNDFFKNGEFSFEKDSIVEHYPQFMKEQVKSDPNVKQMTTVSTQSRVLIFADMYEEGVPIDFAGTVDEWNEMDTKEKEKISWVERTRNKYINNIDNKTEAYRQKLYKELGVTGDALEIQLDDQDKLIKAVQKEILSRGLNKNVEDYIVYDPITKKNKLPLDYAPNRTGIGDIVLGIIDKKVRRQKTYGSGLIQIAGAGFERKGSEIKFSNPTKKQIETYGTNGLNFYYLKKDKKGNWVTEPMGIKISLSGDFKNLLNLIHPDGEVVGTRDRLNDIIKADENRSKEYQAWIDKHKNQLTVVGCRIPVGDTNFHDVMIVKEFLPESQGDVIILPHEVTVKSGTDFDVDKMTFYRPVINSDGSLAKAYTAKEILASAKILEDLESKYESLKEERDTKVSKVVKEFKNINQEKSYVYQKIGSINDNIQDFENQMAALEANQSMDADEKAYLLDQLDKNIESEKLTLRRTLSSMDELKALSTEVDRINKEISKVKNEINDINKNLDSINHLSNEMINIYSEILTNPLIFRKLITPSTNNDYKEKANEVGEKVNRNVKTYKNSSILKYKSSFDKALELLKMKKLLGAFAKNNKYGPLFQMSGIGFNFEVIRNFDKNGNPIYQKLRTWLMEDKEEKESRKNGVISLGRRLSFDEKNLQDLKSQGIVSTVDIASDPTFSRFGVNDENVGVFLLLLNLGVPLDRIAAFINQPVLISLNRSIVMQNKEEDAAIDIIDDSLKKLITNFSKDQKFDALSTVNQKIGERFSFDELNTYLTKNTRDLTDSSKFDKDALLRQRDVLAHYLHLKEMANDLRTLQSNTSWDTNKNDSVVMSLDNQTQLQNLYDFQVFGSEGFLTLVNKSFISKFNTNKEVTEIMSKLFPITSDTGFSQQILENLPLSRVKQMKARKILPNDFAEAIIKSFGQYNGMNVSEYAEGLQYGDNTLVDRLRRIKEAYPNVVEEHPFLSKLFPDVSKVADHKGRISKNIQLYRLVDNTTEDQNNYIDQFKKLSEHPIEEIAMFFKDLAILGFTQSGFNKSYLSFFDIVPFDLVKPIFINAEAAYSNLSGSEKETFMTMFLEDMKLQNPKIYNPTYDNGKTDSNMVYYRGKDYALTPEAIKQRTLAKIENAKKKEAPITVKSAKEDQKNPENAAPVHVPEGTPVTVSSIEEEFRKAGKPFFSYKGKVIETEFQLSPGQASALREMIDFMNDPDPKNNLITLQGAAGTGKTSIIGYLQKYMNETFVYAAPTHAATVQLAFATVKTGNKKLPLTLARSIAIKNGKVHFSKAVTNRFGTFPIYVLDEVSMIDPNDYGNLKEAITRSGGKLIFMGDEKQIAKVDKANTGLKMLSPAFYANKQIVLTEVHRQSESNILSLLGELRKQTSFKMYSVDDSEGIKFQNDANFNKEFINDVKTQPEDTVLITYTREGVKERNVTTRRILGKPSNTVVGDSIMGYLGYANKQVENGNIANSVAYTLTNYDVNGSVVDLQMTSKKLSQLSSLGMSVLNVANTSYFQLSKQDSLDFSELNEQDYENNNAILSSIFAKVHQANLDFNNGMFSYTDYQMILKGITDGLASMDVGSDYIYNPSTKRMEIFNATKHRGIKNSGLGSLLLEKGIDYGYAITIHKSQGLTVKNSFFDLQSVVNAKGDAKIIAPIPGSESTRQVTTERMSLAYVGMSRGSYKTRVLGLADDYEKIKVIPKSELQGLETTSSGFVKGPVMEGFEKLEDVKGAEIYKGIIFSKEEADKLENKLDKEFPIELAKPEQEAGTKWKLKSIYYGPIDYKYAKLVRPAKEMPDWLKKIVSETEKRMGVIPGYFDTALINKYEGKTKLGMHTDAEDNLIGKDKKVNPTVLTLSLGASRVFKLEGEKEYKGNNINIETEHGQVLVMGKDSQFNYKHGVESVGSNQEGVRYSITLRHTPDVNKTTQTSTSTVTEPVITSDKIYSELGKNTKSENIVISDIKTADGKYDRKASLKEAKTNGRIYSMETDNDLNSFSNPWAHFNRTGTIKTATTKEAVMNYIEWITSDKFKDVKPERREWIINQLKSGKLKGKPIQYYAELNEPSHATALDYLINKYDWGKQKSKTTKEIELGRYVKYNNDTYIVTQLNNNGTIQIYNPLKEGVDAKKSVSVNNLEILNASGKIVTYNEANYIVTQNNKIISLTTNKEMKWDDSNGNRKEILRLSKENKQVNPINVQDGNVESSDSDTNIPSESSTFTIDNLDFTPEQKAEIITNYCFKKFIGEDEALKEINAALSNKETRDEAIKDLKNCLS